MQSNKIFKGILRINKQQGKDVTAHKDPLNKMDIYKLNKHFSRWELSNSALMDKVFFDIMYGFARCGREGLRALTQDSFVLGYLPDGREYFQLAHHEITKKQQGDEPKNRDNNTERNIIVQQPGEHMCPVLTFKFYLSKRHPKQNAFFQRPVSAMIFCPDNDVWFDNAPIGKNPLCTWMKRLSIHCHLSRHYTNHCIRSTSATALH